MQYFLLLLCLPLVANAQLSETDTARWNINAALSGKLNTGNVERLLLTPEVNLAHVAANGATGFAAAQRYTYGTFGKFRTENDLLSRNFFYLYPKAKFYPFLMVWLQTHERQRLRFRYQAGLGATYALLRSKANLFKLSLTGTYEQNCYKEDSLTYLEDPTTKQYHVVRATVRIAGSHLLVQHIINLYYEGYFQQALNNVKNWRVFAEGGLNVKVINGFGMKVFASYEYQQVHVAKQEPHDLVLNFGLTYRWHKIEQKDR